MNHVLSAQHTHDFLPHTQQNAQKVAIVFGLTVVTMVVEIVAGVWSGSMALLADGWHMGTHAAAFAIAMFAYRYARKHKNDSSFSFGTGKVQSLGGFASAVALAVVALLMAIESIGRLLNPLTIHFNEAIAVAVVGLVVNIVSVFVLHDNHHHAHEDQHHAHCEEHRHHHYDHNLKAAYFHVLADALTSVLAILALCAGRFFGWVWMDAVMGVVGAVIIAKWAYNLVKESSHILLDRTEGDTSSLKASLEATQPIKVHDLHIWSIAENHKAAILSLETHVEINPEVLKEILAEKVPRLSHATIEITRPR